MRPYDPQVIEAFLGRFYGDKALQILPYGYTVTFTGMTAALASTQQLNIAANADFVLMGLRYRAHDTSLQENSTKTAAFGRVLITDSGTNEQFTNAAVDLENYATNNGDARMLAYPRIIAGRSSLTVALTMYAPAAETIALDLFFDGLLVRAFN